MIKRSRSKDRKKSTPQTDDRGTEDSQLTVNKRDNTEPNPNDLVISNQNGPEQSEISQLGDEIQILSLGGEQRRRPDYIGGNSGVVATIDYTGVHKAIQNDSHAIYIQNVYFAVGGDHPHFGEWAMRKLDPTQITWLMHALTVYAHNIGKLKALGLDGKIVVANLVGMIAKARNPAVPGDENGAFEQEVVLRGGWMAAQLLSRDRPDGDVVQGLRSIYFPGRTIVGSDESTIGPLDEKRLRVAMKKEIGDVLDRFSAQWIAPHGKKLVPVDFPELKGVADLLQKFVADRMWVFVLANTQSPLHFDFRYADSLRSTHEKQITHAGLMNWMRNRGDLIGWSDDYGAPFTGANYDPSRDNGVLESIYEEMLKDEEVAGKVGLLLSNTASHSHETETISVPPFYPNPEVTSQGNWRWRLARTIIHEFLHRVTHPGFTLTAQGIGNKQVLIEGFTDMITKDLFLVLAKAIKNDEDFGRKILGMDPPFPEPHSEYVKTGYGKAGKHAEFIKSKVGPANCYLAYFLGDTSFIGLPQNK
ncbi:hypothetical protein [Herbidospora mongoliensis]|uniref:hypothetical protein n=1 Tax=Herbidospora mongoliensis TaxID=688067 RepID=UPI00082D49E8|nr:hypothetical protein [Herbidospora mongoliensis]